MSRPLDMIRRASRALLWRIELRVRHALETSLPLQALFAQANTLDQRTAAIEQSISDLAGLLQHTNDQLAALSGALAQLQRAIDEDQTLLQIQLAPLEARLVRLGSELGAARSAGLETAAGLPPNDALVPPEQAT